MAKRGYKLQEFVAHSTNVNCLNIGKKACRLFITGGDDLKVNLWAIGKPTSLMSLCGHTSPVESVTFDAAEVLVLGGASTGAIKLWDLEEAKIVRTLTGHRANCTAVEFHPFGEFFASGSSDTNLKIWDIRKKGCIHTYKGHTRGISTIKFTPDGRWVVSGGYDNVVKVWDLTAGKLLHDFRFCEGHIRSLDFHPLEFLLGTGSADGTVKFWDLETFELIGSARTEATGVRTITFHPDGRTLFCGLDDCLKVYSWEPVICYDAVDMGWSTLGDLCINEGKLLGCSFYQNSVGVWVADTKLIEPYGAGFITEESDCTGKKFNIPRSQSLHETGTCVRLASAYHSASPDYEAKEIKNIYVDSAGGKPVSSEMSLNSPKVGTPLDSKEMSDLLVEKLSPMLAANAKASAQALNKSFSVPTIVPQNSPVEKYKPNSGTETITFSKTKPGMLLRPSHVRRHSSSKSDVDKLSMSLESGIFSNMSENESTVDPKLQNPIVPEYGAQNSSEEKSSNINSAAEKFEKILLPETPSNQENCDKSVNENKGIASVKIVNGVAVVTGRTRTLVERFERQEKVSNEDQAVNMTPPAVTEANRTHAMANNVSSHIASVADRISISSHTTPCVIPQKDRTPTMAVPCTTPVMDRTPTMAVLRTTPVMDRTPSIVSDTTLCAIPQMNKASTVAAPCILPLTDTTPSTKSDTNPCSIPGKDRKSTTVDPRILPVTDTMPSIKSDTNHCGILEKDRTSTTAAPHTILVMDGTPSMVSDTTPATPQRERTSTMATSRTKLVTERTSIIVSNMTPHIITETNGAAARESSNGVSEMERLPMKGTSSRMTLHTMRERARSPPGLKEDPQISGRELTSAACRDVTEELMQTHDVFLSTLKSRLTKLQVIRHFWERNDIKGAINATRKLPDHSVQADVIGVLMEKMEILTLDLFSCLLPVLLGLLDSKTERHAQVSLEMLLKLVAVFGPVVRSTISAPRAVGVDLHAEQRLECCNQCFMQLQKIQQILPSLMRRGGVLARCAQELKLVLQES